MSFQGTLLSFTCHISASIRGTEGLMGITLAHVGNLISGPWKMTTLPSSQSHSSNSPVVPLEPNWIGMSNICSTHDNRMPNVSLNALFPGCVLLKCSLAHSYRTWGGRRDWLACLDRQLCALPGGMWLNQINGPHGRGVFHSAWRWSNIAPSIKPCPWVNYKSLSKMTVHS